MPHIETEIANHVLELRLARPEKKNALTGAMYGAIADGLASADADPSVRCILLCSEGDVFCAGNDLNDFLTDSTGIEERPSGGFLKAISTVETPIVAAVQGAAVGVGMTMLLHCDFVVATPAASFSVPFVRLGVTPEAASSLLLPAVAGHQRAMELFLLGDPFTAEQALAAGMVNRIVAPDQLRETARGLAGRIAALPPEAVRATKRLVRSGPATMAARIAEETPVFSARLRSPEAKQAMSAFFGRRD